MLFRSTRKRKGKCCMKLFYNVENPKDVKRLDYSKRFIKYPDMFLSKICEVRVNR